MNFAEKLFEHVFEIHRKTCCGSFEGRRKQPRDLLHCDSAGELSRHCPAHAIAYGKNEIDAFGGGFTDLSEIAQFESIELKAQKGIFIVGTDLAPVRQPEPLEASRPVALLIHYPVLRNLEGSLKTRNRSSRSGHRIGDR